MSLISSLLIRHERSQLRKQLLRQNDRQLADFGFSRDLLQSGVRAYPWRAPSESFEGLGRFRLEHRPTEADYVAAVAELQGYRDAELLDLGLSRGSIEEAVRNGRPGFPESARQAA